MRNAKEVATKIIRLSKYDKDKYGKNNNKEKVRDAEKNR